MLLLAGCAFHPGDPVRDVDPDADSRCEEDGDTLRCEFVTLSFHAGLATRQVHFMVPLGTPPAAGWPAAILFQGSLYSAEATWEATPDAPFGGFHQTELVAALLDAGYAVITPEAAWNGATWWDTNVQPYAWWWESSPDHRLMVALLAAIDDGTFGPLDPDALFAAGISSGGYMTSRMAVSYPGRFRALAIESASFATCAGAICALPTLPEDHPPTLFLHGERDAIVPIGTMRAYASALDAQDTPTRVVTDPDAGHEWLEVAPREVVDWFEGE
jgi:pimeloyl-ACP methyl ester carboxylesterase